MNVEPSAPPLNVQSQSVFFIVNERDCELPVAVEVYKSPSTLTPASLATINTTSYNSASSSSNNPQQNNETIIDEVPYTPQVLAPERYVVFEEEEHERYCGPVSCMFATVLALIFWPASACVLFCPCDKRKIKIIHRYSPQNAEPIQ